GEDHAERQQAQLPLQAFLVDGQAGDVPQVALAVEFRQLDLHSIGLLEVPEGGLLNPIAGSDPLVRGWEAQVNPPAAQVVVLWGEAAGVQLQTQPEQESPIERELRATVDRGIPHRPAQLMVEYHEPR